MKTRLLLAAVIGALSAMPAGATGYIGGAVVGTQASGDSDDDLDTGVGLAGFFGYRFEMPVPIFLEADFTDSGELDVEDSDQSLQFSGPSVFLGGYVPLDRGDRFRLWGKVGYAQVRSQVNDDDIVGLDFAGEQDDGFVWGVGGDFGVSQNMAIRLEYRQYDGMFEELSSRRAPGMPDLELQLQTVRLGLVMQFGGREPAYAAPVVAAPAPQRAAPPPPTTYVPPPVAAPPPPVVAEPATPPMPRLAAGRARATAPAALTNRPVTGDRPLAVIPAGEIVQVQNRVTNKDGTWAFVQFAGQTGWVSADFLAQ